MVTTAGWRKSRRTIRARAYAVEDHQLAEAFQLSSKTGLRSACEMMLADQNRDAIRSRRKSWHFQSRVTGAVLRGVVEASDLDVDDGAVEIVRARAAFPPSLRARFFVATPEIARSLDSAASSSGTSSPRGIMISSPSAGLPAARK